MVQPAKSSPARRVRGPRARAAAEVPPDDLAEKTPANSRGKVAANTRTATAGATARTATAATARTAARKTSRTTVTVEPTDVLAGDTPEADTAQGEADGPQEQADVTWRDRVIRVKLPTIEQMTMYRRLSARFQALGDAAARPGAEPMTMEEATKHFDRAVKLVTSVMVNGEDIEWLEDEMLEGRVSLPDTSDLLKLAFDKLGEANAQYVNRQERRAAARQRAGRARIAD